MSHIGLDTIGSDAHNIPLSTPTVGVYVTGSDGIAWHPTDVNRYRHSGIERINQNGSTNPMVGNVFDCERGAGSIRGAVLWSQGKRRIRELPVIYIQASNLAELETELRNGGVSDYWIHLAHWGLTRGEAESLLRGPIKAVQCGSPSSQPHMLVPGSHLTLQQANVDVSVCADDFFPPPHQMPTPHGVANASVHIDLAAGDWHVTPEPGNVRFGVHGTGRWDVEPLPTEGDYWCAKIRISRGR